MRTTHFRWSTTSRGQGVVAYKIDGTPNLAVDGKDGMHLRWSVRAKEAGRTRPP